MAQAFDMRRLHMGCGESLQPHLPLPVHGKRLQATSEPATKGRDGEQMTEHKKPAREESR